jgi:hypothetical protein
MSKQEKLNAAILYAFKSGCFFPVRFPKLGRSQRRNIRALTKWGAMRNLHSAIAEFYR